MKKTKTNIILLTIITIACFIFAMVGFNVKKANAAVVSSVGFNDTFDTKDGELSEKWINVGGASLKEDYTALRFTHDFFDWGAHVVNAGYKLEADNFTSTVTYEFTFSRLNPERSQWFGVSMGTPDFSYIFPFASAAVVFTDVGSQLMLEANGALAETGINDPLTMFTGVEKTKVQFVLDKTAEYRVYNLTVNVIANGSTKSRTYNNVRINDGYFGFNSARMNMDIFEVAVYEDGNEEPAFYDDFSNSSSCFVKNGDPADAIWHLTNNWDVDDVIIGKIGKLDLTKVDSGVLYNTPFEKQTNNNDLNLLYTLSANFYTSGMNNADTGFVIGSNDKGEGGSFVGFRKSGLKTSLVSYALDDKENVTAIADINSNSVLLTIKIYNEYIEIIANGNTYVGKIDELNGYFGIFSFGEGKGALVDVFSYNYKTFINRENPDSKVSFNDTIGRIIADEKYYDFYLSTKKWYAYEYGIRLPLYTEKSKDNGYLIFQNSSDLTCFGPKVRYNDFIVRFDLTFKEIYEGSFFGITFAKSLVSESASNSMYIGIQNIQGTKYISNRCLSTEGLSAGIVKTPNGAEENIFENETKINVMFVVNNGIATMHFKRADEAESVLAFPRATFVDLDTDGYVTLFAVSMNFYLDNFSVVNLDKNYFTDEYNGDENLETIRYDFSKIKDAKGIKNAGAISSGAMNISNGIETEGKVGANITRFKTKYFYGALSFVHGNTTITIDSDNLEITAEANGKKTTQKLPADFKFDGAVFEIEELYKTAKISFVSGDAPYMEITNKENSFVVDTDVVVNDSIKFECSRNIFLSTLSIFNLDTKVTIPFGEVVLTPVRVVREAIQDNGKTPGDDPKDEPTKDDEEESSGCSLSVEAPLFLIPTLLGVAVALIIKRKREVK